MIRHLEPDDLDRLMNGDASDLVERSWRLFVECNVRMENAIRVFGGQFTPGDMRTLVTDLSQEIIRDYGANPAWLTKVEILYHSMITDFAHDDIQAPRFKRAIMEMVDPTCLTTTAIHVYDEEPCPN